MAPEPPAGRETLVGHLHGADPDIIDRADVPAQVMQAGAFRFHERDHVVIAAVDGVHEGDHVAGTVGEPQPQRLAVEHDGLGNIAGEDQHMREPPRLHHRDLAAARSGRDSGHAPKHRERRFLVGRTFFRHPDLNRSAIGVAEPEPVRFGAGRRIDARNPHAVEPLAKARQVIVEGPEGDELQFLLWPFHDRAPAMRMAVGVEAERAVLFLQVEPEQAVELLGVSQIRNRQVEVVERMDAKLAGTALHRLGHRADLGHDTVLETRVRDRK